MTYDFFAAYDDQIPLVEFILRELNLHIYESYSEYGKDVREYDNSLAIAERLKTETNQLNFQLWAPRFGGAVVFRRIELDPARCNGQTFRCSTDGLGLIQLYLGAQNVTPLSKSHVGHFNEKGAVKWEDRHIYKASQWNWKEIDSTSRKIKYYLQKQAVSKREGYDVLKGAVGFT